MLGVAVGSGNPVKREAVRRAFERVFPAEELAVEGRPVSSGVSEQPWGEAETRRGALNRARAAVEGWPEADFHVGLEGGVEEVRHGSSGGSGPGGIDPGLDAFARVTVLHRGSVGESSSGRFRLPEPVAELVRGGVELGEADDRVFGREGSKTDEGAVGLLTGGAVTRTELYAQAVCLALCRFVHPELYRSR